MKTSSDSTVEALTMYETETNLPQKARCELNRLSNQRLSALEEPQNKAEYASALGLDAQKLVSEVLSRVHLGRVREDFRSGARCGVNGTPPLFINGVRYDGRITADELLETLTENLT